MAVGDGANPAEAVGYFLKGLMAADAGGRVFSPELPEKRDFEMPTAAIVAQPAGGGKLFGGTRMEVYDTLVDVLCYGSTRFEGDALGRKALEYLRLLKYAVVPCPDAGGKVLLYWARIASGLQPRVEGQAEWPFSEFTVQVMHSALVL